MIYKNLENTGISIPAIAQGTARIGNYAKSTPENVRQRIDLLRYGISIGLTFIDTAELYGGGFSEEVVGKAIMGIRDKVFLASKFNPRENVRKSIETSIENSLKRLKTKYIDLYQIHWPNPSIPLDETMEALSNLVDRGRVRYVGVSNFCLEDFKDAQSLFGKKLVSNQLEYNLLDRSVEDDFIPYCNNNDVTLLAYSPLNHGKIFCNNDQKTVLEDIAQKYNKTSAQIVLRWLIEHKPVIVITKTNSMARMKENAAAVEFDLDREDIVRITALPKQNYIQVPVNQITPQIYTSLQETEENKLDLIPSPVNLAKLIIENRKYIKPIRICRSNNSYIFDTYDVMDQVKKYWAWILAYGYDTPIPAFLMEHQQ